MSSPRRGPHVAIIMIHGYSATPPLLDLWSRWCQSATAGSITVYLYAGSDETAVATQSGWVVEDLTLPALPHVVRVPPTLDLRNGWGSKRVCQATVACIRVALHADPDASWFQIVTGSTVPICSANTFLRLNHDRSVVERSMQPGYLIPFVFKSLQGHRQGVGAAPTQPCCALTRRDATAVASWDDWECVAKGGEKKFTDMLEAGRTGAGGPGYDELYITGALALIGSPTIEGVTVLVHMAANSGTGRSTEMTNSQLSSAHVKQLVNRGWQHTCFARNRVSALPQSLETALGVALGGGGVPGSVPVRDYCKGGMLVTYRTKGGGAAGRG
jgi:hypothetical protein